MAAPYPTPAGSLDPTFDGDGYAVVDASGGNDFAQALAVLAGGTLLAAGFSYDAGGTASDFLIFRLASGGSPDMAFDGDGRAITDFANADEAFAMAVLPDGRFVVAGRSNDLLGNQNIALARYNADGSLDASFDGDGKLVTVIGNADSATGVALQPDGKTVVAGHLFNGVDLDIALIRYNLNGSLDPTFSGDGVVTTGVVGNDLSEGLALQADGKILVLGQSGTGGTVLARYEADGSLDAAFGTGGILAMSVLGGSAVAVQSDGRILVAGSAPPPPGLEFLGSTFALARFNSDGTPDLGFGDDGLATANISNSGFGSIGADVAYSLALQPDGNIVLAGGASGDFPSLVERLAIARFTAYGTLDTTLGSQGTMAIEFSAGAATGTAVALEPAGAIVVAGVAGGDALVARITGGLADQSVAPGSALQLTLPSNAFTDPEGGPLAYSASLPDGSALPAWLAFDSATRTFSGTPPVGTMNVQIQVAVTDAEGLSASDVFVINPKLVIGTLGDDVLTGLSGNDSISAREGNDSIAGLDGDDWVHGNQGRDTIAGEGGNDDLRGGNDDDLLLGGDGDDTLTGALGSDELQGGAGNDELYGRPGSDTLVGGGGDDLLSSGQDPDLLFGGDGDDTLRGMRGNDEVSGGVGADRFWFHLASTQDADVITDFEPAIDTIELSASLFFAALADQAGGALAANRFASGPGVFAQSAAENVIYDTLSGMLSYDDDGSGPDAASAIATLAGAPPLASSDIVIS